MLPLVNVGDIGAERLQRLRHAVEREEIVPEQFAPCRLIAPGALLREQADPVAALLHLTGGDECIGFGPAETPETLVHEKQFHRMKQFLSLFMGRCHLYPPARMKILEATIHGDQLSLRVIVPRLDILTASGFKKECEEVWQLGIALVQVNLLGVQFVDSSGVGALLSLYKRLPAPKPSVKLHCVQPSVQAVIELLRLHRVFEIET